MNKDQIIFRQARREDSVKIWDILQQAIERRRKEGSQQWQDGYPNLQTVASDIDKGYGYVLTEEDDVLTYCALIFNNEPAYDAIEGKWLSNEDFYVVHRVAVADSTAGKGYATEIFRRIENLIRSRNVFSIKVDTNFDNSAMLRILDKLGYTYCGQVYFRGSARRAYEKVLK